MNHEATVHGSDSVDPTGITPCWQGGRGERASEIRMTPSVTVLINPVAGGGRGASVGRQAVARLRSRGAHVVVIEGRTRGDALELVRRAVRTGTDTVVVVGGDGTANIAAQALAHRSTPLAVIPTGTGNDLGRLLGVPISDVNAAADLVIDNASRTMDIGLIGQRFFTTVASCGFDALVSERADRMRWPRGPVRYDVAMVMELARLEIRSYDIDIDGNEFTVDAAMIAIGNGSSYGGGMQICPDARVDDGQLNMTIVGDVGRGRLLRLSPTVYRGTHTDLPEVNTYTGQRIGVAREAMTTYVDGDRGSDGPITATSVADGLRVIVGPTSYLY